MPVFLFDRLVTFHGSDCRSQTFFNTLASILGKSAATFNAEYQSGLEVSEVIWVEGAP